MGGNMKAADPAANEWASEMKICENIRK